MALTSASTFKNALDQYLDNLAWEGDVTKARAALEAIRYIQVRRPLTNTSADGRSVDYESLFRQQQAIEEYLRVADTTNRPRCSFTRAVAIQST
jgi:hypothetical protein